MSTQLLDISRRFFTRHPIVRDALIWSIPAFLLAFVLRAMLLSYSPHAYWGKDSTSYFNFAEDLLRHGSFSFDAKRRYFYQALLLPIALLPGPMMPWIAVFQHALGAATVVPIAYVLRRTCGFWRWLVIPVTLLYAGFPALIWYEHEVLGEAVFVCGLVWAFAGWVAWVMAVQRGELSRARSLWWFFFVPFALVVLTKPSARFLWPGIVLGWVLASGWRTMTRRHWISLVALMGLSVTVGDSSQAARLLYTSSFPLTRLDTPLHAEYKAEIRDMVEPLRENISSYYLFEDEDFLKKPDLHPDRPLWAALPKDTELKARVYKDLALEGIRARPDLFLWIALQRTLGSVNPSEFDASRFEPSFYTKKFERLYNEMREEDPGVLNLLFALPKDTPPPPYEKIVPRISPRPDYWTVKFLEKYAAWFHQTFAVLTRPRDGSREERPATMIRPTLFGIWILAGIALSLCTRLWRTIGIWTLVACGYGIAVFLVGSSGSRYFVPVWPFLIVLTAVPAEMLLSGLTKLATRRKAS